jgi:hypothetical protein
MNRLIYKGISATERILPAALVSLGLFGYFILYRQVLQPDLKDHILYSSKMMEGTLVAHPVFFFLLQLFSGFSNNPSALLFSAFLVFSTGFFLKYYFSLRLLEVILEEKATLLLGIIVLLSQFAIGFLLLQTHYVKASLSPNFFHNGTLLISFIPSLYLLTQTLQYLRDEKPERRFRMLMAGVLIVLTKPSFLFCWIPVVPVYVLIKEGAGKKLLHFLQIAILLVFCLIIQSYLLRNSTAEFKLVFSPFRYFGSIFNHFLVLASALFFPLISFIPGIRFWKTGTGLLLVLMAMQGLLISFCFYDTIKNVVSPNMFWQSSMMHYLLFLFAGMILHDLLRNKRYLAAILPALAFFAQVLSGAQYLRISAIIKSFFV